MSEAEPLVFSFERPMTRRSALRASFAGIAALPLVGCSAHLLSAPDADSPLGDGGPSTDDGNVSMSDASAGSDASALDAGGRTGWATGGTAAMVDRARYPDPFTGAPGSSCSLLCGMTVGPCHVASTERSDVSDGWDGLPVRLALRVLDESCAPISDAVVEIWHTNHPGVYSGRAASICNTAEADRAASYFRGYLRTDADGRVDFDTCFPGVYPGRAVHIHFRVMLGAGGASSSAPSSLVSQLFFADALVREIFASEPLYRDSGEPDTMIGSDFIIGSADDPGPYICDVARLSDGAMHASKTLIVRPVPPASLCTLPSR